MATVVSLTEAKIKELLAGWEGVSLSQEQINALVAQLWTSQATLDAMMETLREVTLPQLQGDLDANSTKVSELNDTILPNLEADLEQTSLELQNLVAVDLPSIQQSIDNEVELTRERPKVFVQAEPPPAYDDLEERDLVVGDTWFDIDDNNKQYIWNGVEWSTMNVNIGDFSLTVRKFLTTKHQIY